MPSWVCCYVLAYYSEDKIMKSFFERMKNNYRSNLVRVCLNLEKTRFGQWVNAIESDLIAMPIVWLLVGCISVHSAIVGFFQAFKKDVNNV